MNATRVSALQEHVAALAKSVAFFESKREELLRRRQSASDSVIVQVDELLKANTKTFDVLKDTLALATRELDRRQSIAVALKDVAVPSAAADSKTHRITKPTPPVLS